MTWHPEILGNRQKRVLDLIGPVLSGRGFFLVGGTAVALQFGHRRSVDFDWFTREEFDPLQLAQELRDRGIPFVTDSEATNTLHGAVRGIQISLIRHNYPFLGSVRIWRGIRIAARADLAAMKLSAIAQRGAKKDFVDIYALGKRSNSLKTMLQSYRKKFGIDNIVHLVRSLSYFEDAEREKLPRMVWKVNWRTIRATIERWVRAVCQAPLDA
jgi:hypothetical protein